MRILACTGERPEDQEGVLQGQKLQKAHSSQSNPVQDRQSQPLRTRSDILYGAAVLLPEQFIVGTEASIDSLQGSLLLCWNFEPVDGSEEKYIRGRSKNEAEVLEEPPAGTSKCSASCS